jgi:hypothetical protein
MLVKKEDVEVVKVAELQHETVKENVSKDKKIRIKLKRTGFDGEDEGLIFLTGIALLIVLLLLAYMYSNGRI